LTNKQHYYSNFYYYKVAQIFNFSNCHIVFQWSTLILHILLDHPARALRALGLLLADGAPTVGGGKTF